MKHNLLGAVSTIALGAAFGIGGCGTANAYILAGTSQGTLGGLTCTGTTAGFCTETVVISATKADFTNANANNALTLDKWYAPVAGDKLTSVSYSGGGGVSNHGTLTNTGSADATGNFHNLFHLTLTGGTPSNFLVPNITGSKFAASGNTTIQPGKTKPFTLSGSVPTTTVNPVLGSLTGFVGPTGSPGFLNALAQSLTSGGTSATPSTFNGSQNISETAFITITYNFTTPPPPPPPPSPTPEPASMALLGVGLAGLGAIRRRRKA